MWDRLRVIHDCDLPLFLLLASVLPPRCLGRGGVDQGAGDRQGTQLSSLGMSCEEAGSPSRPAQSL